MAAPGAGIIAAVPRRLPSSTPGGRPLDPDRPNPDDAQPAPEPDAASDAANAAGGANGPDAPKPSGTGAGSGSAGPATGGGAARGAGAPRAKRAKEPPPSLKSQIGATRDAILGLLRAHVDLAKSESAEIFGEVKVVAAAVGLAFAALILLAFLLPIGLSLFLGEWLFGSMGWGVLLATEGLILVGTAAVLGSLGAGRVPRALALAFLAGTVVAILFGTNAPNTLYSAIADQFGAANDPGEVAFLVGAAIGAVLFGLIGMLVGARGRTVAAARNGLIGAALAGAVLGAIAGGVARLAVNEASRPMVVGLLLIGVVAGIVGLILGARSGGLAGALGGFVIGFVLGGALGAFSAITFSWQVAIAIGIALFLAPATGLMGADVATRGLDMEALKARFYPETTIETTKETIEWAKARIPGAPRS